MKRTLFPALALFLIWLLAFTGCSRHPGAADSARNGSNLAEDRDTMELLDDSTASLEILDPFVFNNHLTLVEKLDSTASMIENANTLLLDEQFAPAGYWFALAKVMLANINPAEVGEYRDYYIQLVRDINNFYNLYVSEVEELPLETPPEAVLAGVQEAEGDTMDAFSEGTAEGDSLTLELSEFSRPEVVLDSTETLASLDSLTSFPDVPLEYNEKVERAIQFFQTKGRKVYTIWLQRAGSFIPRVQPILEAEGLPDDIIYLSMIESGFNVKAYSYAHAVGPWQFISSTGRIFGLETGYYYDERRDISKSTHAAARYLKKLYREFGDWYLAFAAYNCGEGRVGRLLKKYPEASTFWDLPKLPAQTRNYVPTYIAAAIIAKNPEQYGFEPIQFQEISPYDSALVTECVDFPTLAELAGVTEDTLRLLNPALVRGCTPPDRDETWVYLPAGDYTGFTDKVKDLPPEKRRKYIQHTVRRGETLASIANKYRTSVDAICRVKENKIRNRNRISPGKSLVIPVLGSSSQTYVEKQASPPPAQAPGNRERQTYVVRKGDTISSIANRFGTTTSALCNWNKIYKRKTIYPDQELTVYVKPGGKRRAASTAEAEQPQAKSPAPSSTYVVKNGDTIWDIAQKRGIPMQSILSANKLTKKSKLKVGQKLKLPGDIAPSDTKNKTSSRNSDSQVHVVGADDTLWSISQRYGVTVADLKNVNELDSNNIKRGQRLKIPSSN